MILNNLPSKKHKRDFIKGFLDQHKKYLLDRVDNDIPQEWNSWHIRKMIRDTIKCYELSEGEEKRYQKKLFGE